MPTAPSPSLPAPERGFVSSRPAASWEEGLLSGNGTIGINALSRPLDERIIFTHERLFMPMGAPVIPPDQSTRLGDIRSLIERGQYGAATQLQFSLSGQEGFMYPDFFVPAFDLSIRSRADGEIRDYGRSVDFRTGETTVHWVDDRGTFERRAFVSRNDRVAAIEITCSIPGSLNCRLALLPREPSDTYNHDSDVAKRSDDMFDEHVCDMETRAFRSSLTYRNQFRNAYPGSIRALEGYARVITTGGTTEPDPTGTLTVNGADRILMLIDIRLLQDGHSSEFVAMETLLEAIPANYIRLLKTHAQLHGELFNRMRLDLGGGIDHRRNVEELLESSNEEIMNPALIEKLFDAGRYNIISCTGDLPPALQGIWGGTYVPDWAGDFTHNGNVPSAIAANLMGHMPELMLAYTSYIESLIPGLETNARHLFGARGIVLPSRTSTHGYNNALAPTFAGGFWVGGAGWAAHFFYDYYLYTGDRDFLAGHALPFMEKVAAFFEDYLYAGPDDKWIFSPTQSPENTPGNTDSQGTFNATMDIAIARELLKNTIAASLELEQNADKIPHWKYLLKKMPEYMVDENGIIKEWLTESLENNDRHRHSSQLYPLFDGIPDEISRSPKLRAAFTRSIAHKLDQHWGNDQRGFMSFGLVQLGLAAGSLGEGELAYRCLTHLVNRFWLSNLASTHNHRSLFNMDISGGMPAVMIKMLVYAEVGKLALLPALPTAWPTGTIEGVLCRGQIQLRRMQWVRDEVEIVLHSSIAQSLVLELPATIRRFTTEEGDVDAGGGGPPNQRNVILPAEREMTFTIRYDHAAVIENHRRR